ncbi:MAG: hypothetical protein ABI859_00395 [Pseudomonadota bacterium]
MQQFALIARKVALIAGCMLQQAGCSGQSLPATVGAHTLVFQRLGGPLLAIATPPLATSVSGSVIIVGVGRGDITGFSPPRDNQGAAAYLQLGETHAYSNWPKSGTALYVLAPATGGPDHVITTATPPRDEVTLAAIEVVGSRIQDVAWNEVLAGNPITSGKVKTTGPATLVAFWWGDGTVRYDKTAVPDGGFQVIDAVLESGALVQCAVAVKQVSAAGSYDVTWKATPKQGAQMWVIAIQ